MDKNKSKSAKIALIITIVFFSGIMSYAFIASNSPINPPPQTSTGQNGSPCPGTPTVTDIDGNVYKTVLIGNQCWMKENLKATKDPDGKTINRVCYNDDPIICNTYGGIYDWNTTMNNSTENGAQGICPNGWHVPKDSEWYVLESGLAKGSCNADRTAPQYADCDQAGTRLKPGGDSGFENIFAGVVRNGKYQIPGKIAYVWSSTSDKNFVLIRVLRLDSTTVDRATNDKADLYPVRCLKN